MYYIHFWKKELATSVARLRRYSLQRRWSELSEAVFERTVIIGFYIIRKLLEVEGIDTEIGGWQVAAARFRSSGISVPDGTWPTVDEYFDLSSPAVVRPALRKICDFVIHSRLFTPWFDHRGALRGFFIASDHTLASDCYRVELSELIRLFDFVSRKRIPNALLRFGPEENRIIM